MKWSENDLKQLNDRGISVESVEKQISNFRDSFPYMKIVRAATIKSGIKQVSESDRKKFVKLYEDNSHLSKCKFVPASGAATRMFKALFEFESAFSLSGCSPALLENDAYKHVKEFFDNISRFAFYSELEKVLAAKGKNAEQLLNEHECNEILDALLGTDGLNYRNLPKGLLHFHAYPGENRTAIEEHLVEGALYETNSDNSVIIHFTVSPEHLEAIRNLIDSVRKNYEDRLGVSYNIDFSVQKPSTDTIAVDRENNPFRNKDGTLLFRPAGHGALLDNMSELDSDIIFIKNIDNVVPDRLKEDTVLYKKVLGGILVDCRNRIFGYLEKLSGSPGESLLSEIEEFARNTLCIEFKSTGLSPIDRQQFLTAKLNRPLRVCGMVKNSGEPGGGPVWARNPDKTISLQIVETSQVNTKDIEQNAILGSATHFNPVDLVCSIKDYKGNTFDLHKFRDPCTGFISRKSANGRPLKAQELPGLWNGAMSDWNTLFVEVPLITFNPVKVVNDLLRPEHQQAGD